MKHVTIFRSQLVATVEDEHVFVRPIKDPIDMPPAQLVEDQRVRYEAWDACKFVVGGASVFAGTCDGIRVYVVIPKRVYDEERHPVPVLTKDEDDIRRLQEEREAKRKAKRSAAVERREQRLARYEIIPKHHGGVDYGIEQRVLIRTKDFVLTWRPGRTAYLDRGAGQVYSRGEFSIMPYTVTKDKAACDHLGISRLGYVCKFAGEGSKDIPAPKGFKMSPKSLIALFHEFEEALGLEAGYLDRTRWTGEKTLII